MRSGWIILAAGALVTPVTAGEMVPGLYEITYHMEMPHLERYALPGSASICIRGVPFPVFSGNGAFDGCEVKDRRSDAEGLHYTLACKGASGARAFALYKPEAGGFRARILVKLGAKNMTLTEVQVGRRVANCVESE